MASSKVECSVCGDTVGRLGIGTHASMHKRQYREQFNETPDDYDTVREAWPFDAENVSNGQREITEYGE